MHTIIAQDKEIFLRVVELADIEEMTTFYRRNREPAAEFEPLRPDEFFTPNGQKTQLEISLELFAQEKLIPGAICLSATGAVVGRINLTNVSRGYFQNATLGYIVDYQYNGRGIATSAVRLLVDYAFNSFGLHRVEAGTLLHNHGSQRVLEKNGFRREGIAKNYLFINGYWQDHQIFARTVEDSG
jgi:[ribosomal protein S5]-alanine N-acetyltransferase